MALLLINRSSQRRPLYQIKALAKEHGGGGRVVQIFSLGGCLEFQSILQYIYVFNKSQALV